MLKLKQNKFFSKVTSLNGFYNDCQHPGSQAMQRLRCAIPDKRNSTTKANAHILRR
jgi:hypothetical protein